MKKYILWGLLLLPGAAWACSCDKASVFNGYKSADIIFSGQLISQNISSLSDTLGIANGQYVIGKKPYRKIRFTFKIDRLYKGQLTNDTITVITNGNNGCAYYFQPATEYLIYSSYTDWNPNNFQANAHKVKPYLTTGICSRTKKATAFTFFEKGLLNLLWQKRPPRIV